MTTTGTIEHCVALAGHSYPYLLSRDDRSGLIARLRGLNADRFFLIVERPLGDRFGLPLNVAIEEVAPCHLLTFEGGERSKHLRTVNDLAEEAFGHGATRQSCVIGLGGGLTGNVAGLVAALMYRGIRLVQMPTTFLAMSDSVLSLKQTVNAGCGKNLLGTFHRPEFVWVDLGYLDTLPPQAIRSGLCELIKNVLTIIPNRHEEVAGLLIPTAVYTEASLRRFLDLSLEAKCSVMGDDPRERRSALILEYGHTVGHALELESAGEISHGIAVGLGMLVAAKIACGLGLLSAACEKAHLELLQRNGAPTSIPAPYTADRIIGRIAFDNKSGYVPRTDGFQPMILLRELGVPAYTGEFPLTPVPVALLREAIEEVRE
jgi:3-dehydroquinate synthetase